MRSFTFCLLFLPSIVFAGNNHFLPQNLGDIQQQNQKTQQRMQQSAQKNAVEQQQVRQRINNNSMATIMYQAQVKAAQKGPMTPSQSQIKPPSVVNQQPTQHVKQQPEQFTTPTQQQKQSGQQSSDNVTGLSRSNADSREQQQSSGWNYGF